MVGLEVTVVDCELVKVVVAELVGVVDGVVDAVVVVVGLVVAVVVGVVVVVGVLVTVLVTDDVTVLVADVVAVVVVSSRMIGKTSSPSTANENMALLSSWICPWSSSAAAVDLSVMVARMPPGPRRCRCRREPSLQSTTNAAKLSTSNPCEASVAKFATVACDSAVHSVGNSRINTGKMVLVGVVVAVVVPVVEVVSVVVPELVTVLVPVVEVVALEVAVVVPVVVVVGVVD